MLKRFVRLVRVPSVGIQIGESPWSLLSLPPLSSNCRLDDWDSPSKVIPLPSNCEHGVSAIRIGVTYLNGCLMSGESPLIRTPEDDQGNLRDLWPSSTRSKL